MLRWQWLAVHFKIEPLLPGFAYPLATIPTVLWETLRCCITLHCVVRFQLAMSWPSMFLFGSAILHANNPLKNVSSVFVLLCKKVAPFHFIQATPQLVFSALKLPTLPTKLHVFSRLVSHPIERSYVKPWSVREHDATWVRLFLPFVFEQLRLIQNTAKNINKFFFWEGHGLFGLILAAPLCMLNPAWHQNSEPGSCAVWVSYRCQAKFLTYNRLSVVLLLKVKE